jgi:hypothetical protein
MIITDDGQVTANWWTYLIKGPHNHVEGFFSSVSLDRIDLGRLYFKEVQEYRWSKRIAVHGFQDP